MFNQFNGKLQDEIKSQPVTHAKSNLGIRLNGKLVLYLEDLAHPKIELNLVPNCL